MWLQIPNNEKAKQKVLEFFDLFHKNTEGAFALVEITPYSGKSRKETEQSILTCLWEDLEDFWEDLADPSLSGSWLENISPLRTISPDALGWDIYGEPGMQTLLVNVHCFGEPTDVTARFSVKRMESGFQLALDGMRIM